MSKSATVQVATDTREIEIKDGSDLKPKPAINICGVEVPVPNLLSGHGRGTLSGTTVLRRVVFACLLGISFSFVDHLAAEPLREFLIGTPPDCNGNELDCGGRDMDFLGREGAGCWWGKKARCRERRVAPPVVSDHLRFELLTYNVFGRPYIVSHDGQTFRFYHLARILAALADSTLDAVVFEEAFETFDDTIDDADDQPVTIRPLLDGLDRAGFVYRTPVVGQGAGRPSNGGVFIASRWPITAPASVVYSDCNGSDCLAAKGAAYARIEKRTKGGVQVYHVVGTHLQAWYSKADREVRKKQARELLAFIRQQAIPTTEPVLLAGDLNTDWIHHRAEAMALFEILGATLLPFSGATVYSSNPEVNVLVGADGAAADGGCEKEYLATRVCSCCPQERLDFVLSLDAYAKPGRAEQEIHEPVAEPSFAVCMSAPGQPWHVSPDSDSCARTWTINDLSDHFPVVGRIHLGAKAVLEPEQTEHP